MERQNELKEEKGWVFTKVETEQNVKKVFAKVAAEQNVKKVFTHVTPENVESGNEKISAHCLADSTMAEDEVRQEMMKVQDINQYNLQTSAEVLEHYKSLENETIKTGHLSSHPWEHRNSYPYEYQMPYAVTEMAPKKASCGNTIGENADFHYQNGKLFAFENANFLYLGNFFLQIIQEKTIIDEIVNQANEVVGENQRVYWHLKIGVSDRSFEGWVDNERLFCFNWVRELSHGRAIMDKKAEVKRLFALYINRIVKSEAHESVSEYTSSGWKWLKDGTVCYLTSSGPVGLEYLPIRATSGFDLLTEPQNSLENFRDFMGMRRIISGNPRNAVFLQYYLMVALMTALYKKSGHQIEFCTALIGKTNTKKTTCGEIFTRVFNRTKSAVPEINFAATEAAIFEIMDKYADTIVMIDDLTPSENDLMAREKMRKLEDIIRTYGDRVPRRRSITFSSNKNAKEFIPPNGCGLLTGEEFGGVKSSRSRVVQLRFEDGDVDNIVLSHYQEHLYTLPNFVYDFIKFVTGQVKSILQIIGNECESAREQTVGIIKLPRYVDAYGVFCAATRIFHKYIMDSKLMDAENAKKIIETDRMLIMQILQDNDNDLRTISPGVTILEALKTFLDEGRIKHQRINDVKGSEDLGQLFMEGDTYYYISAEKLWQCSRAYADYRRLYFPYSSGRDIINPLKAENIILLKKEGSSYRSSHKLVINGKVVNQRFLHLYKDKVAKLWTELEQY